MGLASKERKMKMVYRNDGLKVAKAAATKAFDKKSMYWSSQEKSAALAMIKAIEEEITYREDLQLSPPMCKMELKEIIDSIIAEYEDIVRLLAVYVLQLQAGYGHDRCIEFFYMLKKECKYVNTGKPGTVTLAEINQHLIDSIGIDGKMSNDKLEKEYKNVIERREKRSKKKQ